MTNSYEDRYVAYISVIGFSKYVEESSTNTDVRNALYATLKRIAELGKELTGFHLAFTSVAGIVVISLPVAKDVRIVVDAVVAIASSFAAGGFPVRGGIARGPLHHVGAQVVGPALLTGYALERDAAFYPRVIFQPGVLEGRVSELSESVATDYDSMEHVSYLRDGAIRSAAIRFSIDLRRAKYMVGPLHLVSALFAEDLAWRPKYNWFWQRYYSESLSMTEFGLRDDSPTRARAIVTPQLISAPEYENRLVIFMDVLGFGSLIQRIEIGEVELRTVLDMFSLFDVATLSGGSVTVFSDSIAVSMPVDRDGNDGLLVQIASLCFGMLLMTFPVRGAITVGEISHSDFLLFGPALTRVEALERTTAIYPRVIFDPQIDWSTRTSIPEMIRADMDAIRFLNFLRPEIIEIYQKAFDANPHPLIERALARIVSRAQRDPSIKMKVWWLDNLYSRTWTRE